MHNALVSSFIGRMAEEEDGPVFPNFYNQTSSTLGRMFRNVLAHSGVVVNKPTETNPTTGDRRRTEPLSFHSLRHSAITELKSAGASNAVAESVAGHESSSVNRAYTHVSADDLRRDVERLPSLV